MESILITHSVIKLRSVNTPRGKDVIAFEDKSLQNAKIYFSLGLNVFLFVFRFSAISQHTVWSHGLPEGIVSCNTVIDD